MKTFLKFQKIATGKYPTSSKMNVTLTYLTFVHEQNKKTYLI